MLARLRLCSWMVSSFAVIAVHAADIPALVQKAKPAIVEILTYDQQNKLLKTGTGFFISPDGELLTNYHVISGGSLIMAKMPNGAVFLLKSIVTASETYDIVKLQFVATDVPCLTLGSSSSAVEGQRILVIGNPEGLEGTVSDGIISAFRSGRTMIQITGPVSPGSSGSPVLDESGNVIGIATQVWKEGQNLNFAISAETIRDAIAKSSAKPTPNVTRDSAEDYFNRADREMRSRNYQSAIIDYTEAIRLKPDWAQAYSDRGNAYDNLGQYDKAVDDFTEVIRLEPKWISAYSERGHAYSAQRLYRKAVAAYTEAIRLWPDDADLYDSRAIVFDKLGNHSRAEQDRRKAKELKGH
jgi:hypothetical protein